MRRPRPIAALVLLAAALTGCGPDAAIELTVRAGATLDAAAARSIHALVFDFSGPETFQARRDLPGGLGDDARVRYTPQPGVQGTVLIDVTGLDDGGAARATGQTSVDYAGARVTATIALEAGAPAADLAMMSLDLAMPPMDAAVPDLASEDQAVVTGFSPVALFVRQDGVPDGGAIVTAASDNGVVEPGERVVLAPAWRNDGPSAALTGTASSFVIPSLPGSVDGDLFDGSASYGTVATGATAVCTDCYSVGWSKAHPYGAHYDGTFVENAGGRAKSWVIHVGRSFSDVPETDPDYAAIETLFHVGSTAGCSAGGYCPASALTFSAAAVFIARAITPSVPASGTIDGSISYSCTALGTSYFTDVAPTDAACAAIHYLRAQQIAFGCGGTSFCPGTQADKGTIMNWLARAVAPAHVVPTAYTDLTTGRSYSCDPAAAQILFTDLPASDVRCKNAHYLWARGDLDGCTATTICPATAMNRGPGAGLIQRALRLRLYGP